jgi:hypothetical protein
MTVTLGGLAPATGTQTTINNGLIQQGTVVQYVQVGSSVRTTYTSSPSGNGTAITQLNLTITPKRADSVIWLRWTVFYEMHQDNMFLVQKDSSLIGYNTYRGNVRWSGILAPRYDNDYSSTPQVSTINWFDPAINTTARTYSLAVRGSGSGTYTFGLNRSLASTGTDGQEVGHSWGWAREIAG